MTYLYLALYWLGVAILDYLAYKHYHKRWIRRERARITLGVVLVMAPALALALLDLSGLWVWLAIFGGFGVAGAVTLYLDIQHETSQAEIIRREVFGHD